MRGCSPKRLHKFSAVRKANLAHYSYTNSWRVTTNLRNIYYIPGGVGVVGMVVGMVDGVGAGGIIVVVLFCAVHE